MCQEPFTQMVHKYQNLVFSICVKMTGDHFAAEDLTQETFLSAYRHKEEFDGKNEKAWLCRIASNKCIDYSRQAARRGRRFMKGPSSYKKIRSRWDRGS